MTLASVSLDVHAQMGRAQRLVESQQITATLALTDSLEEQDILEAIIDSAKPPLSADTAQMHYLLAAPFRYPPLRHGSRFGTRSDRGIFYASLQVATCLAEVAYYRFCWWYDMAEAPPQSIESFHTLFDLSYRSDNAVDLASPAYSKVQDALLDPFKYSDTQQLGERMRESDVQLAVYPSARCPAGGRNVAIFSPEAIHSNVPENQRALICYARSDVVFFIEGDNRFEFPLSTFLIDAELPRPAY